MVKVAMIGILAIFVISVVAVIGFDSELTGNAGYGGYGHRAKIYGPGIKNVYKTPQALGKAFQHEVLMSSSQSYMMAHKDKWVCGKTAADGPDPCMVDETDLSGKTWCCLPSASTASKSLAPPKKLSMMGGIAPKT